VNRGPGRPPRREDTTDEQLLVAYGSGEDRESAFTELVERYERRVYGICHRYFGERTDAEDATQEAFLRIARGAATFTGDSKLSTWIYRVTINACHDLARKRARRPQTPVADVVATADAHLRHEALGWDHGDPAISTERTAEIQMALLGLDEVSRALLILVALEGASYGEAAAALDLPVGTAKSRVHRARAKLAEILAGTADPRGNPPTSTDVPPGRRARAEDGHRPWREGPRD
jgi:RNA polymerase sigma-70 factor, ECF subfamily